MQKQSLPAYSDRRYYPFTEVNPYSPWYSKFKIAVFGESSAENLERNNVLHMLNKEVNDLLSKGRGATGPEIAANVGIGTNIPTASTSFVETLNTANKLNSAPPTPIEIPLQNVAEAAETAEWTQHERTPSPTTPTNTFNTNDMSDLADMNLFGPLGETSI